MPVAEPTLAVPGELLLRVPPGTASLNVDDEPLHMDRVPVIPPGTAATVTMLVAAQPKPDV